MSRVHVAVIGGGRNCEHAVSVASAAGVRSALDPSAYAVVGLTIGTDGDWYGSGCGAGPIGLAGAVSVLAGCDVVFPVVHGPRGEDGTLAALCELAGLPYVGSGVRAGALAMDKWATKLVAEALGIATADGRLVTAPDVETLRWTRPVVVKPVAAGSSHGVSRVDRSDQLLPALMTALALDDRVLVEELVVGREVDVAVLARPDGSRLVTPALEIVVEPAALFDTATKYDGSARFVVPAPLSATERDGLEQAALTLFDALGCDGVARFDFFLTAGGLVLNEVNTMPGLTEHSQVPRMLAAAGVGYSTLLDELVRGALRVGPR